MDTFIKIWQQSKQLIVTVANQYRLSRVKERGLSYAIGLGAVTLVIFLFVVGIFWSNEPEPFSVQNSTVDQTTQAIPGQIFTSTLIQISKTLLDKPGGYLSNDRLPPSSLFGIIQLLDNIPSWEYGCLVMIRDTTRVLRNDFSRSQSQSLENSFLSKAEPQFNYDHNSWLFPATENEFRQGLTNLDKYLADLTNHNEANTQFFTRADNLNELLSVVEKRLGNLSQRLNASVQELRINTDLAGDTAAQQATQSPNIVIAETPWLEIDNVFYESRGYVWALLHILQAIEMDFNAVLKKKNAVSSLQQVIRLLDQSLASPSSPMILNGDPMGWLANYSKGMVSYISPANAAIIDLRNLLANG